MLQVFIRAVHWRFVNCYFWKSMLVNAKFKLLLSQMSCLNRRFIEEKRIVEKRFMEVNRKREKNNKKREIHWKKNNLPWVKLCKYHGLHGIIMNSCYRSASKISKGASRRHFCHVKGNQFMLAGRGNRSLNAIYHRLFFFGQEGQNFSFLYIVNECWMINWLPLISVTDIQRLFNLCTWNLWSICRYPTASFDL